MQAIDADNLQHFIDTRRTKLQAILNRLQWTEEKVLNTFNNNSIAALQTLQKHQPENNVSEEDPELPPSLATINSVTLTEKELQQIVQDDNAKIPKKFSDLQVYFSREQKLSIYEHIVGLTGKCTEAEPVLTSLYKGQQSLADIVVEKKLEKKKKRRYRKSKPSHIEEVRSLVDLQMQALQQYLETPARKKQHDIGKCDEKEKKAHSPLRKSRYDHDTNRKITSRSVSREYGNDKRKRDSISSKRNRNHSHKYSTHNESPRSCSRSREKKHKSYNWRQRSCSRSPVRHKKRNKSRSRSRSKSRRKHSRTHRTSKKV